MNTPKSAETEEQVIEFYLYGYTTEEISRKCKVSTGYVSGVVHKLREDLESQKVSAIISFTRGYRQIKISLNDVLEASKIHSILKKFGGNIDDLPRFLSEVYQKCKDEEINMSQIIQHYKDNTEILEKTGLSFEELNEEYSKLADKKEEIENAILKAEERKITAEKEAEHALSEKDCTISDIEEFNDFREEMGQNGLDSSDIPKACNALKQLKQCKFEANEAVSRLQEETSHEQRISQYQDQEEQLKDQNEELEKQIKDSTEKLDANQPYLDIIRRFESDEIKVTFLEDIHNTITEISKQHSIDKNESIIKFHDDIQNNYDATLGLEIKLKSLNGEIDSKSVKLDSLETKIENLKLKYKEDQNIIDIIKSLKQKVNPQLIIIWNNIFRNAKINPKNFELQLEKIGTLEKIISSKQQEITELINDKKQLEIEIGVLEENKESMESKINYIEEIAEKRFEKYTKFLLERFLKFHSNSLQLVEGVATHSMDKISQTENSIKKDFEIIMTELGELMNSNLEASEKIGKLKAWHPLYELVAESKFDSHTTIPILVIILERVRSIFKQENISTSSMDSLISQLKKMIP